MTPARRRLVVLLIISFLPIACRAPRGAGLEPTPAIRSEAPVDARLTALRARSLEACPCCRAEALERGGIALRGSAEDHPELADALTQTGSRTNARVAKWVLFGLIVLFLVLIDIILLPGYHSRRDRFPCTRVVIIWCGH